MHCNVDGCGYWRGNNGEHSLEGFTSPLSMFKVNGEYVCQECLKETIFDIEIALKGDGY